MSQQDQATGVSSLLGQAVNRTVPLVKMAVLLVSVAAAIPTARNLYYSYSYGIPFNQVSHRLVQYDLWMRNLDCKIDYRALLTANSNRVDAGACPKTGDIAIKVSGQRGQAAYEWIAADQLRKPSSSTASLIDLLIPAAHAEGSAQRAMSRPPGSFQIAQAGMEVMCQAKRGDKIVRVVKDAGKCFREIVAPLRGGLEKREEVACTTTC